MYIKLIQKTNYFKNFNLIIWISKQKNKNINLAVMFLFLAITFYFNTNLKGVSFWKKDIFTVKLSFFSLQKNIIFTRNLCYNLYENNVCWRVDYIWNSCRPFSVVFTRARYKQLSKTEVVVFKTSVFLLVKYQLRWCEIISCRNCEIWCSASSEMK